MADIKQFLLDWFKQKHFDLMSPQVRARFDDYAKRSDFAGNMKNWVADHLDASGVNKLLPTLTDEADLKKLYDLCQDVLQDMANNRDNLPKGVQKELDNWFGPGKSFQTVQATPAANTDVQQLINVLETNKDTLKIASGFRSNVLSDISIDDLIKDLKDKKYNNNAQAKQRLRGLVEYVNAVQQDRSTYGAEYWPMGASINFHETDFDKWFAAGNFNKTRFSAEYPVFLQTIMTNDKFREEFAKHGSKKTIISQYNKAISETNYENKESKDFVPPLVKNDEKNLIQKIKSWKEETYENYFRKFTSSRGSRIYFSPFAHEIIKAIDKSKVKPTDGIDGIINKADEIKKAFADKSPTAKAHFEWFVKSMADIKTKLPKSYAGALKGGPQLRRVVSELIIQAVENGKIDEAKTALEILSVCKYGYTTSKTMDALKKEFKDFSLFSDKELSWNNNKGVQLVTKAFDKTLQFGARLIGRGFAMARNIVQQHRSKFNGKPGELQQYINRWRQENAKEHNDKKALYAILNNEDNQLISDYNTELGELATGTGRSKSGKKITSATIDNLRNTELPNRKTQMNTAETAKDAAHTAYQPVQAHCEEYENNLWNLDPKNDGVAKQLNDITAELAKQNAVLTGMGTPANAMEQKKQDKLADLILQLEEEEKQLKAKKTAMETFNTSNKANYPNWKKKKTDYETAQNNYQKTQDEYNNLDEDIKNYDNLNTEIKNLNDAINKRNNEVDDKNWTNAHTDKYIELMSYWDTLQSFSKTHSFALATTKMQAHMLAKSPHDRTKTNAQWQAYQDLQNYSYR